MNLSGRSLKHLPDENFHHYSWVCSFLSVSLKLSLLGLWSHCTLGLFVYPENHRNSFPPHQFCWVSRALRIFNSYTSITMTLCSCIMIIYSFCAQVQGSLRTPASSHLDRISPGMHIYSSVWRLLEGYLISVCETHTLSSASLTLLYKMTPYFKGDPAMVWFIIRLEGIFFTSPRGRRSGKHMFLFKK